MKYPSVKKFVGIGSEGRFPIGEITLFGYYAFSLPYVFIMCRPRWSTDLDAQWLNDAAWRQEVSFDGVINNNHGKSPKTTIFRPPWEMQPYEKHEITF